MSTGKLGLKSPAPTLTVTPLPADYEGSNEGAKLEPRTTHTATILKHALMAFWSWPWAGLRYRFDGVSEDGKTVMRMCYSESVEVPARLEHSSDRLECGDRSRPRREHGQCDSPSTVIMRPIWVAELNLTGLRELESFDVQLVG